MQADLHDTMRQIIDKSLVGEASPQEQQALRKHLLACAACQKYASDSLRAIVSLGGFSFAPSPGLTEKVHASLALRAQRLQSAQPSRQRIVRVSIVALLLTIAGTFGAMHVGSPLAAALHLPRSQAQAGLFTFWIAPSWCFSLVLPVLLLLRARSTNAKGSVL
ncbi:MAG TPA: zf-HC2 domain-containing protein [Acidobacteriaceae bacterium]|nr:zf-HC2 domain-containing protein [Acidobacteriaceae bacterium]